MAHFFLSLPGALACAGLGVLVLTRRRRAAGFGAVRRGGAGARAIMPIVVSAVILGAGLWVILSGGYDADAQRWASGSIGTVVGYWLKP